MSESLGVQVAWDGTARKVTAVGNNSRVELFIGNSNYKVNGVSKVMDVEPFILMGNINSVRHLVFDKNSGESNKRTGQTESNIPQCSGENDYTRIFVQAGGR